MTTIDRDIARATEQLERWAKSDDAMLSSAAGTALFWMREADEAALRSIEARNPGIDIEQVWAQRAASRPDPGRNDG